MSPVALALLLAAAVLHAGWNLLVKRAGERYAFTFWATVVSTVVALPALAFVPPPPPRAIPYALASAACEVAYFLTLVAAYGRGDFSLVYPVARGAAPALLALWAALFLGERPGPAGLAGLGLIVAGLVVVGSGGVRRRAPDTGGGRDRISASDGDALLVAGGPAFRQDLADPGEAPGAWDRASLPARRARSLARPGGLGAALAVAFFISAYSAIDGAAVRFAPPLSYTLLVFVLTSLILAPLMLRRHGAARLAAEWRASRLAIATVGIASLASYALVLTAFSLAPVAYAGAVREVSVVLAALAGWLFLGEGFGARRTAGAVLVFAGIVVIAAAGR